MLSLVRADHRARWALGRASSRPSRWSRGRWRARNGGTGAKLQAYECGIEPTRRRPGGGRFPVKYYLTAMLFILFDIEIIFLYPWAVAFTAPPGFSGWSKWCCSSATVLVAYAYVWRRGGLEWD